MTIWHWLNSNSAAVQSIAALFSIMLTLFTIYVLWATWKAIQRQAIAAEEQAEAARAMTKVAQEQMKAAIDSADSARRQSELLSSQIEQSVAPLLVAELTDSVRGVRLYQVWNRGHGIAFQVWYWIGNISVKDQSGYGINAVAPSTIGPGDAVGIEIPREIEVFTLRYKGSDHLERWTEVFQEWERGQKHWVKRGTQTVLVF